jgi:hypothetical protein
VKNSLSGVVYRRPKGKGGSRVFKRILENPVPVFLLRLF